MKKVYILLVALFVVNGAPAQWVAQNSGTTKNLNSVFFTDSNNGYAVGDSGTILKTTNGGIIWTTLYSGTDSVLTSVCFPESNTGYAVGYGGTVLKTTNGGMNWINQSAGISGKLNAVYFTDSVAGYIVGSLNSDSGIILKTSNGGNLWSINYIFENDDNSSFFSVYFTDANTGYAVGTHYPDAGTGYYSPLVLKTTNSGTSWSIQNTNGGVLRSVYCVNADTGYVVGSNMFFGKEISKTTNGGIDWTSYTFGGWNGGGLSSVYFIDADTGYTVGSTNSGSGLILKTVNGGITWETQLYGAVNNLTSACFADVNTGYVVGENGTILKTMNGGGPPVGKGEKLNTSDFLKIFPTPAFSNITVESFKNGSVTILDLSGQLLETRQITEPKSTIDVSGLKRGIYFVRVTNDKTTMIGRFIKD